jgi:integrase
LEGKRADDRASALAVYDTAPKPGITFRQCTERFIEAHRPGWSNPKHASQWSATLATYAYPVIGNVAVDKIGSNGDGTDLIMKVLTPIWYTKTETASRVRGRIESILDWARARGYRDGENPARWKGHLDKLLPARGKVAPVKHHAALPYADVPGFMEKLRAVEGTAARALEFTILTAGRTSEVLGAKRSEIDIAARMWTVPASRMKARREHRVPLSESAIAIVEAMPAEFEYLFPGARAGKPLSNMAMQMTLRRMGLADQAVTHGFRSTFRDWGSETGDYPNELLEMAIAHTVSNKVEAAYRRGDLLKKRHQLMADWERFCSSRG